MSQLFETRVQATTKSGKLDSRLHSEDVLFIIFVLKEHLIQLTLTETKFSLRYQGYTFGIVGESLLVNGTPLEDGANKYKDLSLFVVSREHLATKFVVLPRHKDFIFAPYAQAAVEITGDTIVNIHDEIVQILKNIDFVYLNDQRLETAASVEPFEVGFSVFTPDFFLERRREQWKLTTFNNEIIFKEEAFLGQGEKKELPEDFPDYRRSPRLNLEVPTDKVEIQKIDAEPHAGKNSLMKAVLPPLGMIVASGAMMVLSGRSPLMMLGMGFASLLTTAFTVSQYFSEKKEVKIQAKARLEDYDAYLLKITSQIATLHDKEKEVLDFQHPSPQTLASLVLQYNSRIYERLNNNKDFLEISLGLSTQASRIDINFSLDAWEKDPEMLHAKKVLDNFRSQKDVATPLSLRQQTLGFMGTYEVLKTQVANLLYQIAFFHSYRDVNFISLVPEKAYAEDWKQWRFLPHYHLQELNLRGIIYNAQTRDMVLNSFYRLLNQRKQVLKEAGKDKTQFSPHYVLTIFEDSFLAGHGINEFLAEDMSELGVSVIWCKEDQKLLPETVTALVNYHNQKAGQLVNDHHVYVAQDFRPYPKIEKLETAIRRLAKLNHVETEKNAIPESVTFLELYKVHTPQELHISERWSKANAAKTMAVPLGLRGKDDIVTLNFHEKADGPHGLFAGTTGAGKSELAQSLLLSLAVNFAPEDVSFLIIDFKGGGMSALFRKLPHLTGEITNLDQAGVARAIIAFQAELDKRQRLFDKYGVNHINDYTKLYKQGKLTPDESKYPKEPLPHLIIVGDETAELKQKAPKFLDVLVSGARTGRSLGVHQILGTQSPAGVISDQIWDNSKFKLALRMADDAASKVMLKTPDAAHIVGQGRAYKQVGNNEIYELFQSAWSGADYDPENDKKDDTEIIIQDTHVSKINDLGQAHMLTKDLSGNEKGNSSKAEKYTELDAVVDYIATLAKDQKVMLPAKPWLPLLEEKIPTPPVENTGSRNLSVPFGLMDLPYEQKQETLAFDLMKMSHTAIYASSGYGKSTTLQTLVLNLAKQNSPEHVQFNLLDFGTNGLLPLKELPHVADSVRLDEEEKLTKMLDRMRTQIESRKPLFQEAGVSNVAQYEKVKGLLPIIVNVVDSYDAVNNHPMRETIENFLGQIVREGAAVGVYLLITANQSTAFHLSLRTNMATNIALFQSDEQELANIVGRERLAQAEILGRGQIKLEHVVAFQVYLPNAGTTAIEQLELMKADSEVLSKQYTENLPESLPIVPPEYDLIEWDANENVQAFRKHGLPLALALSDTRAVGYDFDKQDFYIMAYEGEEQLDNQRVLMEHEFEKFKTKEHKVVLIDFEKAYAHRELFDKIFEDSERPFDLLEFFKIYTDAAKAGQQVQETLVYIMDPENFLKVAKLGQANFKVVTQMGSKAGLHIIFHGFHDYLHSFDPNIQVIRKITLSGLVGAKPDDSNFLQGNSKIGETALLDNELYYFERYGRKFEKARIPGKRLV